MDCIAHKAGQRGALREQLSLNNVRDLQAVFIINLEFQSGKLLPAGHLRKDATPAMARNKDCYTEKEKIHNLTCLSGGAKEK